MSPIVRLNHARNHEAYESMVDAIAGAISKQIEELDENYKNAGLNDEQYVTYDSFIFAVACDAVDELISRITAYHRSELLASKR